MLCIRQRVHRQPNQHTHSYSHSHFRARGICVCIFYLLISKPFYLQLQTFASVNAHTHRHTNALSQGGDNIHTYKRILTRMNCSRKSALTLMQDTHMNTLFQRHTHTHKHIPTHSQIDTKSGNRAAISVSAAHVCIAVWNAHVFVGEARQLTILR